MLISFLHHRKRQLWKPNRFCCNQATPELIPASTSAYTVKPQLNAQIESPLPQPNPQSYVLTSRYDDMLAHVDKFSWLMHSIMSLSASDSDLQLAIEKIAKFHQSSSIEKSYAPWFLSPSRLDRNFKRMNYPAENSGVFLIEGLYCCKALRLLLLIPIPSGTFCRLRAAYVTLRNL